MKTIKKISFVGIITMFLVALFASVISNPALASTGTTVTRSFSNNTPVASSTLNVSLAVNVVSPDTYYAIDETVPTGWVISNPGTGDTSQANHIKWVVISGATSTTYQYTVLVPSTASGTSTFSGIFGTNSINPPITITGSSSVAVTSQSMPILTSITLAPINSLIVIGNTQQFTATGYDQNNIVLSTQPTFTWTSSNLTTGTINSNGLFSALAVGTSTVTATSGTTTGSTLITVQNQTSTTSLMVTQITPIQTSAISNNTYANGWKWIFNVTVPANETKLDMKFSNWASGSNIIPVGGNVRYFSAQSSNANSESSAVSIGSSDTYPTTDVILNGDLDATSSGRQVQVTVEAKIPVGSANGTYSTTYGIQSNASTSTQPLNIISVSNPANINVATGTELNTINFPDNVDVTLGNNSTTSLPVVWDFSSSTPDYDGSATGTYAFSGTVTLSDGITNSQDLMATENVVVGTSTSQSLNISSIITPTVTVPLETEIGSTTLPETVVVRFADNSTTSLPVIWSDLSTPTYNDEVPGTYVFLGSLVLPLPVGVTNIGHLMPRVNVVVISSSTMDIMSVTNPANIRVPVNTELNTINFPDNVDVTLGNNSTTSLPVVWDFSSSTPDYDGSATGTYAFSGTVTLSDGITNSQDLMATENVVVGNSSSTEPTDIVSVTNPDDINVSVGTELNTINFPDNVDVTLGDNSTTSLPVDWNFTSTPEYDGDATGTYAFIGTLVISDSDCITNTQDLTVTENVVVGGSSEQQGLRAISVADIPDINVTTGTTLGNINFPDNVDVTLSDGSVISVPISLNGSSDPAYDGSTEGTYVFPGSLDLPDEVSNPNDLTVNINVVVGTSSNEPLDAISVAALPDINVTTGTALGDINFPDNVDVTLSDSSVISVPIIINGTSDPVYNGDEDGTYTFSASLDLPHNVANTTSLIANVNVVVGQ